MKRVAAFLLGIILVLSADTYAAASATQWVETDMSGYREIWYVDYKDTVLNDMDGNTPQASGNSSSSGSWIIERCFAAGFEAGRLDGGDSQENVVPVDLNTEENTVYVYAIVTRRVVIGLLFAKVNAEEGTLTIEGQVREGEVYFKGRPELTLYPSVSSLSGEGIPCTPGTPVSIAEDLDGVPAVLVRLSGFVTYYQIVAETSQDEGGRRYAFQDYWKNEDHWKAYRSRMQDALRKVER